MAIKIDIMRPGTPDVLIISVGPDSGSSIQKQLLGDNVASIGFELNALYNFNIGDWALVLGEKYYITQAPVVVKKSKYNYQYSLKMETEQHKLRNAQFLFYDATNTLGAADFSLTGTADDFINMLLLNANRVFGGWIKGGVIATGYKTLSFSKEDCLSVLSKIAKEFETEFYIDGFRINVAKKQTLRPLTFQYGRDRGLYEISRTVTDEIVVTRLYVYGGSSNIPNTYRNFSPRLLMNPEDNCLITDLSAVIVDNTPVLTQTFTFAYKVPLSTTITGLQIDYRLAGSSDPWVSDVGALASPRVLTIPNGGYEFRFTSIGGVCDTLTTAVVRITDTTTQLLLQKPSILENNIAKYGAIEGTLIAEDIYPTREGTVTAVDITDIYTFKDVLIDFDVNAQLLPGLAAKVVFNTGQLAGYKFDIKSFNNGIKEFKILKNKDEKALDLPSAAFKPAIGDKYILLDILMPQAYVDAAEIKLRAKAIEYLATKSEPAYKYTVTCDPAYFRKQNIFLEIGDIVRIIDTELQVDKAIRIVNLTRSLIDEFEYTIELGDVIPQGVIDSLKSTQTINSNDTASNAKKFNNNSLINGTCIGPFRIEQGTVFIPDIETASSTTGMKKLWIDVNGKIWKEA